jgi:TonB family protein
VILALNLMLVAQVLHPCPQGTGVDEKHIGKKLVYPKVIRKIEPEFTQEARRAQIPPSILMLAVVVPPVGPLCDIRVVSPIGFGLDEAAVQAARKWEFRPGMADGVAIAMKATIQVDFSYQGDAPDRDEKRRTQFNALLTTIQEGDKEGKQKAIRLLEELSAKEYPIADAYLALLLLEGKLVEQNLSRALELATRSDKKDEPLGMYVLGLLYSGGKAVAKDEVRGRKLMSEAAKAGRPEAQLWLGNQFMAEGNSIGAQKMFALCKERLKSCKAKTLP